MKPTDERRLIAAGMGLLGAWLLVNCGLYHHCVGGHLAHPDRQLAGRLQDACWVVSLAVACGFALTSNMGARRVFYGLLVSMVATSQLVNSCLALPLTLSFAVFSLNALRNGSVGQAGSWEQGPRG